MDHIFREEVVLPVYSNIACRMGFPDMYNEAEGNQATLISPPGTSILVSKASLVSISFLVFDVAT